MRLELNLDFKERFAPEEFFFGVAYAPYCEGSGLNQPDGPKNTDWSRQQPSTGSPVKGSGSGTTTLSISRSPRRSD
jgi:hypothetical protein